MLVVNPLPPPTFVAFLRETVSATDFTLPTPVVITSRVRHDPFATLPYDVAHAILLLLPANTILTICAASYPVHAFFGPSNRRFWRVALRSSMPWFWELHELMRDAVLDPQTTDYRGLFLWAEQQTRPREGLRGPFMTIANRRRIWGVCEQLAEEYLPGAAVKAGERAWGESAESIWEKSVNVDLPAVVWPKTQEGVRTRTATAQWICDEMSDLRGGVVEVFWDGEGSLVGMVFTVSEGSEASVFGKAGGASKETVNIENGISGLVLHLPDIFLHEKVETSIKGITVSPM
jgi:hypothetical protein